MPDAKVSFRSMGVPPSVSVRAESTRAVVLPVPDSDHSPSPSSLPARTCTW